MFEMEVKMKSKINKVIVGFLVTIIAIFFWLPGCWANEVTIIGEVNDTHQIVTDNQIYEVAENTIGDDLVFNYISVRVKVTGTVTEKDDDTKIITVKSFEVVPD
jgi:hypothetical protein